VVGLAVALNRRILRSLVIPGRTLSSGGLVIVFEGEDENERATLVDRMGGWLAWKLDGLVLHGRPGNSRATRRTAFRCRRAGVDSEVCLANTVVIRSSVEEPSRQPCLYVSAGHRGQDVLRHVLASSAWRPGLIAVVSDSVPLGAAAECDGVPVVAVPTEHTPDAWWAMAAHGIKGVLAVGVPPDLLEELSQKAFPLGVYGLQAGLL